MLEFVTYCLMITILVLSILVISNKNPVHSVLFLIFAFFCAAGMMILLEAEYIAMTTIVVYVGAVVILFLFVIMMLDVDTKSLKVSVSNVKSYAIISSLAFLGTFFYIVYKSEIKYNILSINHDKNLKLFKNSLRYIGEKLYTNYIFEFQIAGLLLFLAMIGSITLILRKPKDNVKKQDIIEQVMRNKNESLELVDVKSRSGVKI